MRSRLPQTYPPSAPMAFESVPTWMSTRPWHAEMIDRSATVAAQHAGGVRVVDHHDGAVFVGEVTQFVYGADVAVHREDAVGDDELAARLVCDFLELLFGVGRVFVAEDFDLGAGEARAVDDARVVELVGDDEVFFAEDRGDGAGVGGESALEDDAGFDIFEARDLFFEFHVDLHGAGDGSYRSRADAVGFGRFDRGFAQRGVVAEAEVVVGGEVDDLLAVVGADGALLVFKLAQLEVGAALLEVV